MSSSEPRKTAPPLFRAARAGSSIGLSTLASLAAGFLLQLAIASIFGIRGDTDAYFMAQGTSETLAKILLGGSITSVFLPLFIERIERGETARAWRLANNLFHLSVILFSFLLIALELFTAPIVSFVAPGFSAETHVLTVSLLRIMLPAFFCIMLAELATSILHSFRWFALPAFARLITPIISLVLVLAFAKDYGVVVLAIGTLTGAIVHLAVIIVTLFRAGYRYEFTASLRDPDIRRIFQLVAPFTLSVLAAQGAGVLYGALASLLPEGSLSTLRFAERIFRVTNTLFLGSITTVAFPALSRDAATRALDRIRHTMQQSFRLMVFFGLPLTLGIFVLREPLLRILYERGSFTAINTRETAVILGILLFGLLANGVSSLLGHLALALKRSMVSVLATIATHALTAIMFLVLVPRLGVSGLALGSAISPYILAVLYTITLSRFVPHLWRMALDPSLIRYLISGTALVLALLAATRFLPSPHTISMSLLHISVGALAGSTAFLAVSWMLRIPEIRTLRDISSYAFSKRTPVSSDV